MARLRAYNPFTGVLGTAAFRGYNIGDFDGNGGNMHRLSRHSPAITAISCLMAMLWVPAAQGQNAVIVSGPVTWIGRLLAIPAATLQASAKQRRIDLAPATTGRFSDHWMPPRLSFWAMATVQVLHAWHHGCHNGTNLSGHLRPDKRQRAYTISTILPPHCTFMQLWAARPPPSTL